MNPHVVMLDFQLDDMTGLEVVRCISAYSKHDQYIYDYCSPRNCSNRKVNWRQIY